MQLVIGNKNYSSWSLRAYLALRLAEISFDEILVPLDTADTAAELSRLTPHRRVPTLLFSSDVTDAVWDSLAIAEWAAENSDGPRLWPTDPRARGVARSATAEMHAGFAALRAQMPMDMRNRWPRPSTPELDRDVARVLDLWRHCRGEFGHKGSFLFGSPTIADCFYAPVASRFRTYAVELDEVTAAYVAAIEAWAPFAEWASEAQSEPWEIVEGPDGTMEGRPWA